MNKGIFISFEGPDGSGKTTQIKRLSDYCRNNGFEIVATREPGGTPISEKIRNIILENSNAEMSDTAEALLFAASRAQHVEQLIKPALEAGKIVICDRFMDSSIAYQGYGRELGDGVRMINEFAVQGIQPDMTFFMDLDPEIGKKRVLAEGEPDRLENEALLFHRKVYEGYLKLSEIYRERYIRIDANRAVDEISDEIIGIFRKYVAERA